MHSLDIVVALICETMLPTSFVWRNPGYRIYKNRDINLIYGGTTLLVTSNIRHALIDIRMLYLLQATAISVELNDVETVIKIPTEKGRS